MTTLGQAMRMIQAQNICCVCPWVTGEIEVVNNEDCGGVFCDEAIRRFYEVNPEKYICTYPE